jgi:exopolysaccharide biosynthesis polyprenyl glycosylphosphotransferase
MISNAAAEGRAKVHPKMLLGQLAAKRNKSIVKLQTLQFVIGCMEYIVYIITFCFLFALKVVPEYSTAPFWRIGAWLDKVPVMGEYGWFLLSFLGLYLLGTYQKQFYSLRQERSLSDDVVFIIRTVILAFLITVGLTFLFKNTLLYSRLTVILFAGSVAVEASLIRYARKWILWRIRRSGKLIHHVLIVGAGRIGQKLSEHLKSGEAGQDYRVIGFLDDDGDRSDVMGKVEELESIINRENIDILYITIPSEREKINTLLAKIYKYPIDIRIIPEMYDRISNVFEYRPDYSYPCLQVVKTPLRGLNLLIKQVMDISLSLLVSLILIPLFLAIAAAIKLDSKGSILYKQIRIGKNGVPFRMYKFRSMIPNAEQVQAELLTKNEASGPAFKIKDDARMTRVGRFIRKYSLDELPQLWNVLRGQMSLIGPRPPLSSEVEQYSHEQWRRLDVRPGMTGLWQVSGRSDLTFDEWVNLDIQYIERWSLALEFKIILKTIPVVLMGKGAY